MAAQGGINGCRAVSQERPQGRIGLHLLHEDVVVGPCGAR